MSVSRAVLLAFLNALVSFVFVGFVAGRLGQEPLSPSPAMLATFAVSLAMSAGGLVWFASVKQPGRTWRELGWHADGLPQALGKGALGGAVAIGLIVALRAALGSTLQETLADMAGGSAGQRAMQVLVGLDAGFVEESLFRGNLQPLLERRLGRWGGLGLTALVFAAYHLNPRPAALAGKFLLGLVFGALRGRDGSLVSPAVAHLLVWTFAGLV